MTTLKWISLVSMLHTFEKTSCLQMLDVNISIAYVKATAIQGLNDSWIHISSITCLLSCKLAWCICLTKKAVPITFKNFLLLLNVRNTTVMEPQKVQTNVYFEAEKFLKSWWQNLLYNTCCNSMKKLINVTWIFCGLPKIKQEVLA